MTRKEKIRNSFEKNFLEYENERIAIYGIGEYGEWIATTFLTFNIIGFLDRWLCNGERFGKPILSYKEVQSKGINIIIIAANIYNTENIQRRMEGFCNDNDIKLFSLEGILLNKPGERKENIQEFNDNDRKENIDEIIRNSRFLDCKKVVDKGKDSNYWNIIEDRFFKGRYHIDTLGRLHIEKAYDIGYMFLGPLTTDFMLWFREQVKRSGCRQVIFSARDGYLLQKLYQYLKDSKKFGILPESTYIFTSRYVCMLSQLYNDEDIIDCTKTNFDGNAELMLKKRFLLKQSEILPKSDSTEEDCLEYILKHKEIILNRAKNIRRNYKEYLERNKIGKDANNIFFDLAASGTCQKVIEKLTEKRLIGAYMLHMPSEDLDKKKLTIYSYREFSDNFADHSMFAESILTSLQPTLLYIDSNLQPVFARETRSESELRFIEEAQKGIFDYFTTFIKQLGTIQDEYNTALIPNIIFDHVISYYTSIDNETFNNYVLIDEIFNEKNSIANKCMV